MIALDNKHKKKATKRNCLYVQAPSQQIIKTLLNNFIDNKLELVENQARNLTQKYPMYQFGWKALGAVLKLLGKYDASLAATQKSLMLNPNDAEAHNNLGQTLQALGRHLDAESSYIKSISLNSNFPEAYFNLGNLLRDLGNLAGAVESYQKCICLNPKFAKAHFNLGNVLKALSCFSEAEISYRESIRLEPGCPEVHTNLGLSLHFLGRGNEAEASYRDAIILKPDYSEAYCNLGLQLQEQGRFEDAEESYQKAIEFNPKLSEAYCNLGNLQKEHDKLNQAEENYRKAIRLKPEFPEAHINLGLTLHILGRLSEAEESFRECIRLKPEFAEAHFNLGNILRDTGRLSDALSSYKESIRLKPEFDDANGNLLFALSYIASSTPEQIFIESQQVGQKISDRLNPKFSSWHIDSQAKRLRIGFVSGDFRNHPVGYFLEGFLQHLDQKQLDLFAFPTTPTQDELTDRIKSYFSHWIPVYGKSDHEAARLIHDQGIHVLIDLSGHTSHNRLPVFAYKPAPIQVSWLGYFATTGLPEMDYILGDPFVTPLCESHYFTEAIWQMPETYLCFTPPIQNILVAPLPALTNGYITFGCLNNLTKMGEPVVALWSRILHSIPTSKLFLKTLQLAAPEMRNRVIDQFAQFNISKDRLILEGHSTRAEHLAAYNKVDIALDPFPYPGGTTSVEALWMGVPVLTLEGNRFLSHMGESINRNAGQGNWIAQNPDDYVNKALSVAKDLHELSNLRSTLRHRILQSPIFNAKRFANNFEDAIKSMWERKKG